MPHTNVKSEWRDGNLVFYDKTNTEIARYDGTNGIVFVANGTYSKRLRATTAQVNAGVEILPALGAGLAYRLIDWTMIAIGGAAQTATSVDIVGTRGASEVRPAVVAVAALTQSAAVKPNSANVTLLADGASHTVLDANTAVTLSKQSGGSNLATATHIDVIVTYAIDRV